MLRPTTECLSAEGTGFPPHRFCIAPMMAWTDRYCRYFFRLLTKHSRLYTEMVTTAAILHGDTRHLLGLDVNEHPVALQIGGSNPHELATCARTAEHFGYDEINLNCGCPSDRVQAGRFGACLMAEPRLVADCVAAMRDATTLPVTVKNRLGVDEQDSYSELVDFVGTVAEAGCQTFIVHARKAWLQGLSPKQNREIPPLLYDRVYRVKHDFPHLEIVLNGGVTSMAAAAEHLAKVDGVMVGREAYQNPYFLADVDRLFFADSSQPSCRRQVLEQFADFCAEQLAAGDVRLGHLSRHILGLFQGQPGGRRFRRHISENAHRPDARATVLRDALEAMQDHPMVTA